MPFPSDFLFKKMFTSTGDVRRRMKNHGKFLSENTRDLAEVTRLLFEKDGITIAERQRILSQESEYEQNILFYILMARRPEVTKKVLESLEESGGANCQVAAFLRNKNRGLGSTESRHNFSLGFHEPENESERRSISSDSSTNNNEEEEEKQTQNTNPTKSKNHLEFLTFDTIGAQRLTKLHLSNVSFVASELLMGIKDSPLESIKLNCVDVIGEFNGKIDLPLLTYFSYHQNVREKCYRSQLRKKLGLKTLADILFFIKVKRGELELIHLKKASIYIMVALGDWRALEFDPKIPEKRDLILNLNNVFGIELGEYTEEFLSLSLRDCEVFCRTNGIVFKNNILNYLNLYDVVITGLDVRNLLQSARKLKTFILWPNLFNDCKFFSVDLHLEDLPKGLEIMSLRLVNVLYENGLSLRETVFESLTFDNCRFPPNFTENFINLFTAKRIHFLGGLFKPNSFILENIVRPAELTEEIAFESFVFAEPVTRTFLLTLFRSVENKMRDFLKSSLLEDDVENFFLKKNSEGMWTGEELTDEQRERIWDRYFQYNKFNYLI